MRPIQFFGTLLFADLAALCHHDHPPAPSTAEKGKYWAVSSSKCKKCSVMLLKVEGIRCKQLSGALEAERFARPSV